MAATYQTVEKVRRIMVVELGTKQALQLVRRLLAETVPSGNKSYDQTIQRLYKALLAQ